MFSCMQVLYILFYAANAVGFLAFMVDKLLARWGSRRIPEAVLLLIGLCGGATGGYISMRLFRHKTRKPLFVILMPILMLLQLGLFNWW